MIKVMYPSRSLKISFVGFLILAASCSVRKHIPENTVQPKKKDHFVEEYSAKLGIQLTQDCNRKLILAATGWLGVPYKYGGDTSSGTDCSGLVLNIYRDVYELAVERSANGIYEQSRKIGREELQEGDLVFFKINSSRISHVGIYLNGGYFIHASTKRGVIVSHLDEEYYAKYYFSSGRIVP